MCKVVAKYQAVVKSGDWRYGLTRYYTSVLYSGKLLDRGYAVLYCDKWLIITGKCHLITYSPSIIKR
jgi:hypothetical protein